MDCATPVGAVEDARPELALEFEDFRDRVFALYSDGRYEELHTLLDGAVERPRMA
jgi:hypothetical protein